MKAKRSQIGNHSQDGLEGYFLPRKPTVLQKQVIDHLYRNEKTSTANMALRLRIAVAENDVLLQAM